MKKDTISIVSEQVSLIYLHSINEADANEEYVNWLNNREINQYLETRFSLQCLESVLAFIQKSIATPNEYLFTIRLIGSNKHIGNIKIGSIKAQHSIGDVSLFIGDKSSWGKGIASQAIQLISKFSFEHLNLRKLCAGAYKPNIGSTKAFLKAGYSEDAILTSHYLLNNKPCDLVQVFMLKEKTKALPNINLMTHS